MHPAVSPNGDGINEFLMIEGIRDYRENRVKVFTFRGVGTSQQRLPVGTYFYLVEVPLNGKWKYHKGYFVLRY